VGEGVVLYIAEVPFSTGFWYDAEGRGLEGADESFQGLSQEGAEVAAF